MTEKKPRGGARPGSGRKAGSGKGRTVHSQPICIPLVLLPEFKRAADREGISLSAWMVKAARVALTAG